MAGLPVINTQESEEYRRLVMDYEMGYNCENGNHVEITNIIECLFNDKEKRCKMG